MEPACAKACPTNSIQFGELEELRERAGGRVEQLQQGGGLGAPPLRPPPPPRGGGGGASAPRLYGHDPADGVGGDGAFFLLLDDPEVYGLPPDPVATTRDLPPMWRHAAVAAVGLAAGVGASLFGRR